MASAVKIRVTPERLDSHKSKINSLMSEYRTLRSKLESEVSMARNGNWKGDANTRYLTQITSFQGDFNKMEALLNSYAEMLGHAACDYRNTEQDLTNAAGNLSTCVSGGKH